MPPTADLKGWIAPENGQEPGEGEHNARETDS